MTDQKARPEFIRVGNTELTLWGVGWGGERKKERETGARDNEETQGAWTENATKELRWASDGGLFKSTSVSSHFPMMKSSRFTMASEPAPYLQLLPLLIYALFISM